ncbi:zinc finger MYM-type protein 5-like [Zingiber officinale]|uniref:zinc finger MYM-type protein 5-like n=1 Tax=Zingiber officinale TaxID=94328 RepID=UPI001C4C5BD9|nr:zinc finger MYM-type protein 5-like [Zingiber officinale]
MKGMEAANRWMEEKGSGGGVDGLPRRRNNKRILKMPPKYLSGAQKRKMKQREEALTQSQAGDINKYFIRSSRIEREELGDNLVIEEQSHNENEELVEAANLIESNENLEEDSQPEKLNSTMNLEDPGNWNNIDQKLRDYLIEMSPKRVNDFLFPKDSNNRHFDSSHYTRVMANGQTLDRRWLVYSILLDKIFCFCCKLFKTEQMMSRMGIWVMMDTKTGVICIEVLNNMKLVETIWIA